MMKSKIEVSDISESACRGDLRQENLMGESQVGEIMEDAIAAVDQAIIRELSPEKVVELLVTLKKRFEAKNKHYENPEGIEWENVQGKLELSPEKLWSLNEMERTGGEPDLMGFDEKTGEFMFVDCSAESPTGRRNCVYDRDGEKSSEENFLADKCDGNAVSLAALMGLEILNEQEYRALQTKGEFDRDSWNWIKTPVDKRQHNIALFGDRPVRRVYVNERYPYSNRAIGAFRGKLMV